MAGIDHIAFSLGSESIPCVDIVRNFTAKKPPDADPDEWAEEFCRSRNLDTVCVERTRGITDVFRSLLGDFFGSAQVSGKDIDLLVYGGEIEHGEGGSRPFRLAHEFDLPDTVQFMWHFQGCATGLSAVNTALERLQAMDGTDALVLLNCTILDEAAHPRFMADMVCGDAVMLLHVTPRPAEWDVVSTHTTAMTEHSRYGFDPQVALDPFVIVQNGVKHLREHLGGRPLDEIDAILPVYNGFAQWPRFARALDYPAERIRLDTLPNGAHIDSIDPLRSLSELEQEFRPGSHAMLYAQTLGITFNSMLLRRRNAAAS